MSSIIRIDLDACNHQMPVLTASRIELPPKICTREKGHAGLHSDGHAAWLNRQDHERNLEKRFDKKRG